jgi:hypothetical protein
MHVGAYIYILYIYLIYRPYTTLRSLVLSALPWVILGRAATAISGFAYTAGNITVTSPQWWPVT